MYLKTTKVISLKFFFTKKNTGIRSKNILEYLEFRFRRYINLYNYYCYRNFWSLFLKGFFIFFWLH